MGYRDLLVPFSRALRVKGGQSHGAGNVRMSRVNQRLGRWGKSSELDELAALNLLLLLINSRTWVHRRVDALRLDLEGSTRRFVSVDITMPEAYKIEAASENRIVVPLGMMRKGAIQRLDAKQDSKGLAVLGRRQNSTLALNMLRTAVKSLPRKESASADDEIRVLENIVETEPSDAHAAHAAYTAWKYEALDTKNFSERDIRRLIIVDALARRLVRHYIFLVEIDSNFVGTRTTLKYSLDQDMPEIDTRERETQIRFNYKLPDFGFAESQHMELEVPSGLCIESFSFMAFDTKMVLQQEKSIDLPAASRVAHAVLNPKRSDYDGEVWAYTVPSREGIYRFAKWAAIITASLVVATVAARCFDKQLLRPEAIIPSPAASIILIAPALLLSWMSRKPEHTLVTRLLAPLRRIVLSCAGILVTMAVLAAVPVAPVVWNIAWSLVYLATAWMAIYSIKIFRGYRKRSGDTITVNKTEGGSE